MFFCYSLSFTEGKQISRVWNTAISDYSSVSEMSCGEDVIFFWDSVQEAIVEFAISSNSTTSETDDIVVSGVYQCSTKPGVFLLPTQVKTLKDKA